MRDWQAAATIPQNINTLRLRHLYKQEFRGSRRPSALFLIYLVLISELTRARDELTFSVFSRTLMDLS